MRNKLIKIVGAIIAAFLILLLASMVTILIAMVGTIFANAAPTEYCVLWSRERARVEFVRTTDPQVQNADRELIKWINLRYYHICLNTEADALTLPDDDASRTPAWVSSIEAMLGRAPGTAPATGGKDAWRKACAAEYRSWDPDTETVVRRGSPKRVPCPCGDTVECREG